MWVSKFTKNFNLKKTLLDSSGITTPYNKSKKNVKTWNVWNSAPTCFEHYEKLKYLQNKIKKKSFEKHIQRIMNFIPRDQQAQYSVLDGSIITLKRKI